MKNSKSKSAIFPKKRTVVEKVETELDAQVKEEGFEQKQSRDVADSIDPITQDDPWLSFEELRDYVVLFERGRSMKPTESLQRDKQFRRRLQGCENRVKNRLQPKKRLKNGETRR